MSAERLATLRRTVDRKMRELSLTQDRRRRTDLEREIRAAQAEIERLRTSSMGLFATWRMPSGSRFP